MIEQLERRAARHGSVIVEISVNFLTFGEEVTEPQFDAA